MRIHLRTIDRSNVWALARLRVREEQEDFVATNVESILEAYATEQSGAVALPFGIYDEETPVGFLMLGYGELPDEENPEIAKGNYCIWRFMIGENYQGRGYAKAGIQAALDYIRTWPCGRAEYCWLSYEPDNAAARSLYHRFGFVENGETDGDEIVAVLRL